ncbi:Modification methylase HgaIB (Cytosine-specificmethyltransferase HgaIB) [Streptococcus sp. HSISB1]|nr:Modification methylase HgaIB (Cytosine-specificmethyltransferase HgaIB) [Streptococcus sp. HSISB1]
MKVLFATPPCQGLSSVGKNKVQKHFEVDRRNFLILEVFDFIDKLDLDYVLIENVPRFLKMYFPYEGKLLLLSDILKSRYGERFDMSFDVLNARNYGISQSRPRAIIKLWKKNLSWKNPDIEPEIPLSEAIGYLPSLKNGERSNIKWHYVPKIRSGIAEALAHTATGRSAMQNEVYYPKKENGDRISGFHNTYKRMSWDEPAPARTTYSGSVSSHNNVHPGRLMKDGTYSDARVLSLLETFIVSSISPDIVFPEKTSDTFIRTIIGEAIPPKMLEKICYPSGGDEFGK